MEDDTYGLEKAIADRILEITTVAKGRVKVRDVDENGSKILTWRNTWVHLYETFLEGTIDPWKEKETSRFETRDYEILDGIAPLLRRAAGKEGPGRLDSEQRERYETLERLELYETVRDLDKQDWRRRSSAKRGEVESVRETLEALIKETYPPEELIEMAKAFGMSGDEAYWRIQNHEEAVRLKNGHEKGEERGPLREEEPKLSKKELGRYAASSGLPQLEESEAVKVPSVGSVKGKSAAEVS